MTLRGESETIGATSTSPAVAIQGTPGGTGDYVIPIEETSDLDEYGTAIVATFQNVPGVTAGWDGQRINFMGAGVGSFTEIVNRGVFTDIGSNGATLAGLSIPFLAEDTGQDLAVRVANAVAATMSLPQTATASDVIVTLGGGATFESAQNPLRIAGAAPGGTITGITFIHTPVAGTNGFDTMYAVTDTGGLFRIDNPNGRNATAMYISSSAAGPAGNSLPGADVGAGADRGWSVSRYAVRNGSERTAVRLRHGGPSASRCSSMASRASAPDWVGSTASPSRRWTRTRGVVTGTRNTDAGHGIDTTFDLARVVPQQGGASLHFGSLDSPGGAHGSMESNAFSLAGYSAADKPVLYFTYFAETEQESSAPGTGPMRDSMRVYIADASGQWELLTTNNSYAPDELSLGPNNVQETYDNNTGWRQVRVELDEYAGREDLKLRVTFATAGSTNLGDPATAGAELRMVPGYQISDGEIITIDGVDFEFDMGYTLVAPSGAAIADGETFQVTSGFNNVHV